MIAVNYLALLAATVVAMIIGYLWYSPFIFGRQWMRLRGVDPSSMRGGMPMNELLVEIISTLITMYVLDIFLVAFGAHTFRPIILLSLLIWLGFYITTYLSEVLWEKKPFGVFLINASQRLVTLILAMLIMGLWQ